MITREEIAQKVLDYLSSRSAAEDTSEGIMNWWLSSDKGSHAIDEVKDALNLLLQKGELEEIKGQKDIFIYKVKRRLKV
jgi:hypothetical protein